MLSIFKKIINKGCTTTQYPFKRGKYPKRMRGALQIADICNACSVCVGNCPTQAIVVDTKKILIDYGKCIFCGKCVQACPSKAIKHSTFFELAQKQRNNLISSNLDIDTLKSLINEKITNIFSRSLHIRHVDSGSCNACDWEMTAMTNPIYDLQRLGIDIVASPRHADILLVTGVVSRHLEQAVKMTYEAVPHPKLVMAVGTCSIDGGIFRDSYAVLNGTDKVIPVDIYVPGCPPTPQAILYGLLKVLDKYPV